MTDEGKCVGCGRVTENTDDGDFICESCLEDAIASQREDERLDDPRHGQARHINAANRRS